MGSNFEPCDRDSTGNRTSATNTVIVDRFMKGNRAEINIKRAGEFFIYTLWLQSQMTDLIILKKHSGIVSDFISNPSQVPQVMSNERVKYWEKQFSEVKREFETIFSDMLSDDNRKDLAAILYLRNAIGHSQVSLGRDYFLYRPKGGECREQDIKEAFGLTPIPNQADPMMIKMSFFDDEKYYFAFNRIKRIDAKCLKDIAEGLGIPHSRIR